MALVSNRMGSDREHIHDDFGNGFDDDFGDGFDDDFGDPGGF